MVFKNPTLHGKPAITTQFLKANIVEKKRYFLFEVTFVNNLVTRSSRAVE